MVKKTKGLNKDPKTIILVAVVIIILCIIVYYFYKKRKDNDKDGKLDPNAPIGDYIKTLNDELISLNDYITTLNIDANNCFDIFSNSIKNIPEKISDSIPDFDSIIELIRNIDGNIIHTIAEYSILVKDILSATTQWTESSIDSIKNIQSKLQKLTVTQISRLMKNINIGDEYFTRYISTLKDLSSSKNIPLPDIVTSSFDSLPEYAKEFTLNGDDKNSPLVKIVNSVNDKYNNLLKRISE